MKVMNKAELAALIQTYPRGGIVFAEYKPDVLIDTLKVTDGEFGATEVVPWHNDSDDEYSREWEGEIFDIDWSINEADDDDLFMVFDSYEVDMMRIELESAKEKMKLRALYAFADEAMRQSHGMAKTEELFNETWRRCVEWKCQEIAAEIERMRVKINEAEQAGEREFVVFVRKAALGWIGKLLGELEELCHV